jgi:flagellar hook-associated protein 1 FlgK
LFIGTSAENIQVSAYLVSRPDYLSVGVLDSSVGLVAGDKGVARGDGSVADLVASALTSAQSFNAAGNFAAQSNTLLAYAQAFIADASTQASIAEGETETSYLVYSTSNNLLTSQSGVNIDEETAKMLVLQNQYSAAAQVVATIQQMLDDLISAIR